MSIKEYYKDEYVVEYEGHALQVLRQMPAESVHMCITSPPYFGLRSYGLEPQIWPCGHDSEGCKHEWGEINGRRMAGGHCGGIESSTLATSKKALVVRAEGTGSNTINTNQFCQKCNAWKGDLGNEPEISMYIDHLVLIFREMKRVLRSDGVFFLNISDSFAANRSYQVTDSKHVPVGNTMSSRGSSGLKPLDLCGIPWSLAFALRDDGWYLRRDIIWEKKSCMPESLSGWKWEKHRVKVDSKRKTTQSYAKETGMCDHSGDFRLSCNEDTEYQDCPGCPKCASNDGLILRKGSWRPTSSHEYVFMFAKSEKYFADGESVREDCVEYKIERTIREEKQGLQSEFKRKFDGQIHAPSESSGLRSNKKNIEYAKSGRNLRSVLTIDDTLNEFLKHCRENYGWDVESAVNAFIDGQSDLKDVFIINPEPTSQKHFASFPSKLCEIAIKAGTSERGCCPECEAPWVRVVEKPRPPDKVYTKTRNPEDNLIGGISRSKNGTHRGSGQKVQNWLDEHPAKTIGWKSSCNCLSDDPLDGVDGPRAPFVPVPCTVLDPFSGSGRALTTARKLGRRAIGIDLKPEYLEMPLDELRRLDRWEKKSFRM